MRLPIAPEAPPSMTGTPANKYLKEWGTETPVASDTKDPIAEIQKKMAENRKRTEDRIKDLEKEIKFLEGSVQSRSRTSRSEPASTRTERKAFQDEQTKITTDISKKNGNARATKERSGRDQGPAEKGRRSRRRIGQDSQQARQSQRGPETPGAHRPQVSRRGATNGGMNQAEEQYTQWVRATYPYVDAFRAPILAMFRKHLEISGAGEYYKKWTDRYTLTKSWQFRSGYRFRAANGSKEKGEWYKDSEEQAAHDVRDGRDLRPGQAARHSQARREARSEGLRSLDARTPPQARRWPRRCSPSWA